jgi:chorismate--pyruvate lyase
VKNHTSHHAQAWLEANGSLTLRLRQLGATQVVLVRQGTQRLWSSEQYDLGTNSGHVREVVITVDGVAAVWARSATTNVALRGTWKALSHLGDRPLADLLFNDRMIERGKLQSIRLARHSLVESRLRSAWLELHPMARSDAVPQWGRSSVFIRKSQPLRVFEAFAPWLLRTAPN